MAKHDRQETPDEWRRGRERKRIDYVLSQLKKKIKKSQLGLVLALLIGLVWFFVLSYPDDKLYLVFCDVGQGDAILISRRFNQVLIDGGPDDSVLSCLRQNLPFGIGPSR